MSFEGKIREAVLRASTDPQSLPPFVETFFRATNAGDLSALISVFHEDAFVNDQLRDIWGISAIADWARHEIVGLSVRLKVVCWRAQYGSFIVTAHADGRFDRRGLPDPLELSLHFIGSNDKVGSLIILQNVGTI